MISLLLSFHLLATGMALKNTEENDEGILGQIDFRSSCMYNRKGQNGFHYLYAAS